MRSPETEKFVMNKTPKDQKEINNLRQYLECIHAISFDCDGCKSVEDLVDLVHEIHELASNGLRGEDSPLADVV